MAAVLDRDLAAEIDADRPPQISWGAVFAGLALLIGIAWLMFLLGSALGVTIADTADIADPNTNTEALAKGLGIGAIIWMLLTAAVAYFLGSLLAARLAGKADRTVGLLHGVTVWGAGTVLMMLLSVAGVSGLIQTGKSLLSGAAKTAATVGTVAATGAGVAANTDAAANLANSPLVATVQAQLKNRASEALAQAGNVSPQQVQQAMNQIDNRTMQAVAIQLVNGNPQGARDILAANTTLTPQQVDSIVNGVSQATRQQVEEAKEAVSRAADTAAKYTQAVLWTSFLSAAIALALSVLGGWMGADTVRRMYHERYPTRRVETTTTVPPVAAR